MATNKKQNIEILTCWDGEIWITGGHFTLEEIQSMPQAKLELGSRLDGVTDVKSIWFRKGLVHEDGHPQGVMTNGWEQTSFNAIPNPRYKRQFPATELLFD